MRGSLADFLRVGAPHLTLPDSATVIVAGGGPAGSFFAIQLLRSARRLRRRLRVVILERKREIRFYNAAPSLACREGCNYCAGGISPKLSALLTAAGLSLPADIVMGRAESITVHGDWKSIELPVPNGRDMLFVFRGSRPRHRAGRHQNFDGYLLGKALEEGATIITGEIRDMSYSPEGRPIVSYWTCANGAPRTATIEADFVAIAAGVNLTPGMNLEENPLCRALEKLIPGFRPPAVRRALIGEMLTDEALLRHMKGHVHFAQYGSPDLPIEMSSLIPKGPWMTIVLLGDSVDGVDPNHSVQIIERFLQLPHIRRLLPPRATLIPGCVCQPNMTIGVARNPCGHRIAIIGDMVVARLYKDGILSAYATASALADCILNVGIDRASLRKGYGPTVRQLHRDNQFGAIVFFLNRATFSHPLLSRIVYQAVVSERKAKPAHSRRLANVLWKIASGDDTYGHILLSMFHPATLWLIVGGGVLVTARNYLAELLFGLTWTGFGRYPTGVPKEDVENKRRELAEALQIIPFPRSPQFERMYSIEVMATPARILRELGRFGQSDRGFFRPRLINLRRTAGSANVIGSTIRYDVWPGWLSFSIVLERFIGMRYLLYRVQDGFAKGGILVFDIQEKEHGMCLLTIYVAFDFPAGRNPLSRLAWRAFRASFPGFVHDVLWNHGLCELKHLIETQEEKLEH